MRALVPALIFLLISVAVAIPCPGELLEPTTATIKSGDNIFLGVIGPGQTIDVAMRGIAQNCGREMRGGTWYRFRVLTYPPGWEPIEFKWMADIMKSGVKASRTAKDGNYTITLLLEEDPAKAQELGTIMFTADIVVDKNVLRSRVLKHELTTGVGLPARYDVVIENSGDASDVIMLSSIGFPAWNMTRALHLPKKAKMITFYEVLVNEEKEYEGKIIVTSQSSALMAQSHDVKLTARSSLLGDIRATKYGLLLFPAILEPFYSLLALIASAVT